MRLICGLHHGFIAGFAAFWWCSRRVITSLHNVPMATGENGCSCVKQTQHFSTFCWDICDFLQAPHILHGNRQFMRQFMQQKCGVFRKNAARLWLIMHWIMRSRNRVFLEGLFLFLHCHYSLHPILCLLFWSTVRMNRWPSISTPRLNLAKNCEIQFTRRLKRFQRGTNTRGKKWRGHERTRGEEEERENRCLWGKNGSDTNPNSSVHEESCIYPLSDPLFTPALSQKHCGRPSLRKHAANAQQHTSAGKSSLSLSLSLFLFLSLCCMVFLFFIHQKATAHWALCCPNSISRS